MQVRSELERVCLPAVRDGRKALGEPGDDLASRVAVDPTNERQQRGVYDRVELVALGREVEALVGREWRRAGGDRDRTAHLGARCRTRRRGLRARAAGSDGYASRERCERSKNWP